MTRSTARTPTRARPNTRARSRVSETTTVKFRSWSSAGDAEPVARAHHQDRHDRADGADHRPRRGRERGRRRARVRRRGRHGRRARRRRAVPRRRLRGDLRRDQLPVRVHARRGHDSPGHAPGEDPRDDKLGNRASSDTVNSRHDGLPTTTIACDGIACSSNWQKGPVEVDARRNESGNGVGSTRYTLDGSDPDTSRPSTRVRSRSPRRRPSSSARTTWTATPSRSARRRSSWTRSRPRRRSRRRPMAPTTWVR